MESLTDENKIKFYGLSIDDPKEGITAIDICKEKGYKHLASLQVIYNILWKNGYHELLKKAEANQIAIIAREPLLRGFLTEKYKTDDNFSNSPEAVKKQVDLFGKEQIFSKIDKIKDFLNKSNLGITLPQLAIKFAISNPQITVTIPGINRVNYLEEDFNAANIELDNKILNYISNLRDLNKQKN